MSTRSRTNSNTEAGAGDTVGEIGIEDVGIEEVGTGQLRLLAGGSVKLAPAWHLDERTRRVGRLGVEQAREVLRRARPPEPKQPQPVRKAS